MKKLPVVSDALYGLQQAINQKQNTSVFGLSFGEKALFLCNQNRQIVYVTNSVTNAIKLSEEMQSFGKKCKTIQYTPNGYFSLSNKILNYQDASIIDALYSLSKNKVDCLIISPAVLMQKFSNANSFKKSIINLKVGKEYNLMLLIQSLTNNGFKRVDMISSNGEYSVRGDIINLFNIGDEFPTRIEFFDNTIDSISQFNMETFKKIREIKSIDILPASYFCIYNNKSQLLYIVQNNYDKTIKSLDADAQVKLKTHFEEFKINFEAGNYNSVKNWLIPFLPYESIESYFSDDALIVFDDVKYIIDSLKNEYTQFDNAYSIMNRTGDILEYQKNYFRNYSEIFNFKSQLISFQQITTANRIFQPEHVESYKSISETIYNGNFNLLLEDIRYYIEFNNKIVIFAGNSNLANYLKNFLSSYNISVSENIDELDNLPTNGVVICKEYIAYGGIFVEHKLVIIGTKELQKKVTTKKAINENKKDMFTIPKAGEYVVHENFGIALCEGVQKLKFSSYEKDYIVLKYADGDKLYLPTEQIGLISTYISGGAEPKLNKLGSREFENIKAKVKSKLKELAFDLVQLYRERQEMKGFKFEVDEKLFSEFENAFQYDETDDQLTAVRDIVTDMTHGKVMDRLLCGDVGYGKTEVALRSAFVVANNNKQTCFLAPTTILSEQHYNTAKSRLEPFGVTVECLNRFKTKSEQKLVLERLKKGEIDVICGTHRLLSSDVVFKDLGLLILDEEQRFGVGDKEKIKRLKTNVDVLTLSATPIPRTLHMGLVGIRDISIISTPPKGRMPVQTTVIEYSDAIILNAINRELNRNGQILIIYNRVETINEFAYHIKNLLTNDVKIGIAHGQMQSERLENEILSLYKGDTQVLISTTLIENGIDLPSANTLIVIDADKLGLSQLYQLKGRVGRSKNIGYAYFTFAKDKALSEDAYKRLNAIMEFTELGSGFKIAMKDLEIRGCGNILGAEQSGHMAKVGYDLYCKILSQAVSELKGKQQKEYKDIKLDIALNCYIPENYIDGSDNRFRIYNNLKQIDSKQKFNKVINEIATLYGNVPDEIKNLAYVALLRNIAREFDVKRISIDRERCQAEFYSKEAMLNKNLAKSLKNEGVKVYYSNVGAIMNFSLSEYSIKRKTEILCEIYENTLSLQNQTQ